MTSFQPRTYERGGIMQIEEGKFYKNRAGDKVGPMRSMSKWVEGHFRWRDEVDFFYPDDGCFSDGPHLSDLIQEWEEPAALPPATEVDEGWGPWNEGSMLFHPISPMACDCREECINGVWRWQSRPRKPVIKWVEVFVQGDETHRGEQTHKILFKKINGVVDCSSVMMEPL
jgi:hypothetical protein